MITHLCLAYRALAKSKGFTAIAVLTLALGIGFSTSSFSMANAFLLRNVPYPDAHQLMRIFRTTPNTRNAAIPPGNILDVRAQAQSFSGLALYHNDAISFGEPGQPVQQLTGLVATADFFSVLGVKPALGRGFAAGEDTPNSSRVVVLTHRGWTRYWGQNPDIVGRTVRLNLQSFTVIGVLPESFNAPLVWGPTDVIVPRTIDASFSNERKNAWMQAVGRLKPGVSPQQAQAELDTIAAQLRQQYPVEVAKDGLRVVDLYLSNMDGVSRSLLWLMTGLSVTMLLIACANLASLQVARAFGRAREFAIRAALGGNQLQLMVPLFTESMLLALVGGVGGMFVGKWTNDIIGSLLIINGEAGFAVPIDTRVLLFALVASIFSGFAFGLAPAWLAARAPAGEALKEGARGSTAGRSHQRLKNALIVGELGLALALVGIAGSFAVASRSFLNRQTNWNMDGVFNGNIALPYEPYHDEVKSRTFQRALLAQLEAIPGVGQAALATGIPMYALSGPTPVVVEGQPEAERGREPMTEVSNVTAGFFNVLGIAVKQGTVFSASLTETDRRVVVINESFARRFWPGENPIGRRIRLQSEHWLEVIGVVSDVGMKVRLDTPPTRLQAYRPLIQSPGRYFGILLRTQLEPDALTPLVRKAVSAVDADLPVTNTGSLRANFERGMANLHLVTVNLAISGGMGLLIAAIGVFGIISQLVAQRTRDIGVRIALGAQAHDVMGMILREGTRLLLIGVVFGIPVHFLLNIALGRAMPEMPLPGLWLLATNLAVLAAAMLSACWLPARRATQIDPIDALRAE